MLSNLLKNYSVLREVQILVVGSGMLCLEDLKKHIKNRVDFEKEAALCDLCPRMDHHHVLNRFAGTSISEIKNRKGNRLFSKEMFPVS